MTNQHFTATIVELQTRPVILIPFNPNEVWGGKQRHIISGLVNGFKIRGPINNEGNQFFLTLGKAWCRDTGLKVGDKADVTLSPEGPQSDKLTPDIVSALDAEPQAKVFFDALATFYRKNYIRWIESAKRPETRSVRIMEMIKLLNAGKKQK